MGPATKASKLKALLKFDSGQPFAVVGLDEVGRGCLAGPVVAAAVILPVIELETEIGDALSALDDSKKLTPARREKLDEALRGCARFAIAMATVEEIDRLNILNASLLAMKRAVELLGPLSARQGLLVDGNKFIPGLALKQKTVVKGDAKSAAIAAASVIAKVYRDRMLAELSLEFPQYGWSSNKGYGSKVHCNAILDHGLTVHHRKKFCQGLIADSPAQLSLVGCGEFESGG